jgi:hypothetical protein
MKMTEEQAVLLGERLDQILQDEAYLTALKIFEEDLTERILTSLPNQKEQRELAYTVHWALREVTGTMLAIAVQAQQIAAARQADYIEE